MLDFSDLKELLITNGQLTEKELIQAEDYAQTRNISLNRSLVFLQLIDFESLGRAIGSITGRAYCPLVKTAPPEDAKIKVPLKFVEKWGVFPVAYDSGMQRLTLACAEPDCSGFLPELQAVFPPPLKLEFTVASEAEIEEATDIHYKGKSHYLPERLSLPEDFSILERDPGTAIESKPGQKMKNGRLLLVEPRTKSAEALKMLLASEGFSDVAWIRSPEELQGILKTEEIHRVLLNGETFPEQEDRLKEMKGSGNLPPMSYYELVPSFTGQIYPYAQMAEAFVGLAAELTKLTVGSDQERVKEILTKVRYCKLLSLKLELTPAQADATVLAAWLTSTETGKKLAGQVATPYQLQDIMNFSEDSRKPMRVEAAVLRLVETYLSIRKKHSGIADNPDMFRKLVVSQFSDTRLETYVEIFIKFLKDEEFLKELDRPSHRILIVDEKQDLQSSLVLRLANDGYAIDLVADGKEAVKKIISGGVDLVLSELQFSGMHGIKLCKAVKNHPKISNIPFVFLTDESEDRIAADCLEAGADEFIAKSANLEFVSLKIKRLLAAKDPSVSQRGVSGSMKEMDATDFIQSLSGNAKSVRITIESGGESGFIYMQDGEVINAQFGSAEGEDAFYKLAGTQEGNFQIIPWDDFPERTIRGHTMSLLMEAARQADEKADE